MHNFKKNKRTRINQWIRVPQVRVIREDGEQLGVLPTNQALAKAEEAGLDLVEISPNAKPPVCKIMDHGKFKYQKEKKEQKQKKKQKKVEVKGVRISLRISKNDLEFKAKQADKFFKEGNKVRVELIMRGRENAHRDLAKEKLKEFIKIMEYKSIVEQEPKKERLGLAMIIAEDKSEAKVEDEKQE
ncbi:translation initiation factor IF-3 [Patescibacteria group bacterium]|nr:translation initiation factor IF-3 [Patescibacteria group bacterium]